MAGLLDFIKTGTTGDPAIDRGLLQAGLALLQGKGNFGSNLGQAGMQALTGAQNFRQNQFQQTLQKNQLEELQRKRVLEDLPGQFVKPAQTGVDAIGGMDTATSNPANYVPPQMDLAGLAQKYLGTPGGLQQGLALQQSLKKDTTPINVAEGGALVSPQDPTKVLFKNQKADAEDPFVRLLKQSGIDPMSPQGQAMLAARIGKETSHPLPTNIKIDNKLGEGLAKEVGPMVSSSYAAAQGAQQQIINADNLVKALDSNKILTGPGATFRLKGAQIGQALGIGGADSAEVIANTRTVIQGLAQSTVAARSALKGQGQVSDFEGKLLEKAASGNIEDMTAAEIKQVVVVNKRLAQQQITNHKTLIGKLKSKDPTAGIADLFDLPPQIDQVRKFNPATGKIE